ncbi:MAG TPA: translation initiation factor IF-3 [Elusimicrobia bacterium]|nr:MAG: translation initiation factor IF-3 [Elusimicrobia bacterium GWF2_62_30]HBA61605.1 translation initiation factor IF-3 [Elusimicrobiota bacterium]
MYHDKRIKVNRNVTAPQVRLIDMHGTMLGIKPLIEAVTMAKGSGLDLVEISPDANPPVCKVMDFSKYLYEKDKQDRENRKKQRSGVIKEIRLNPRIATHDLQTKVKHIEEFLKEHNKVRVTVVFRGRENQHRNLGEEILMAIKANLSSVGTVEGKPSMMGNRMSIMLAPTHGGKGQPPAPVKPGPAAAKQPAPAPAPKPVQPPQAQ